MWLHLCCGERWSLSPVNTRRWPNVDLMVARRRLRRRATIKSTLGERLVFAVWCGWFSPPLPWQHISPARVQILMARRAVSLLYSSQVASAGHPWRPTQHQYHWGRWQRTVKTSTRKEVEKSLTICLVCMLILHEHCRRKDADRSQWLMFLYGSRNVITLWVSRHIFSSCVVFYWIYSNTFELSEHIFLDFTRFFLDMRKWSGDQLATLLNFQHDNKCT